MASLTHEHVCSAGMSGHGHFHEFQCPWDSPRRSPSPVAAAVNPGPRYGPPAAEGKQSVEASEVGSSQPNDTETERVEKTPKPEEKTMDEPAVKVMPAVEISKGAPSQPTETAPKQVEASEKTLPSQSMEAETKQVEKTKPVEKMVDKQVSEPEKQQSELCHGGVPKEYEYGWSEEHLCAWRKEIKGPSLRGPVEYSNKPEFISGVDEDSSVRCLFSDGDVYDVGHITMVSRKIW